jgi:hypothetical protein
MNRFSGRDFSDAEIQLIREVIAEDSNYSRNKISQIVCRKLSWYKPDGFVKDMSCRVALLRMQEAGLIVLPKPKNKRGVPNICKNNPETEPSASINRPVHKLPNIKIEIVNDRSTDLWNQYIHRYHYLGYSPIPGAQLRYIVKIDSQIIALLSFGASAWKCAPRDEFIGWQKHKREEKLNLIVNNSRFLILPWIKSKNLASKILSLISKRIRNDWIEKYNYAPVLMETFVDTEKFNGGCYKASNWIKLGETKGRGKKSTSSKQCTSIKSIWIMPLVKNYKKMLTG